MISVRVLILLISVFALSGCSGHGDRVISSGERYVTSADAVEDYRLGVGDKIRMSVYREAELSDDKEFAVAADGNLSLPLIGNVPALGRKIDEVVADARSRYADGYLRDPKVAMQVTTYRPFFILGEVTKPGDYPYVVGLTVMNAVATAEGYTARSDRSVVRIRRQGSAEEEYYKLTPELRVYPGDTIRIGERFF